MCLYQCLVDGPGGGRVEVCAWGIARHCKRCKVVRQGIQGIVQGQQGPELETVSVSHLKEAPGRSPGRLLCCLGLFRALPWYWDLFAVYGSPGGNLHPLSCVCDLVFLFCCRSELTLRGERNT